jgi:hypothetical protein
LLAKAITGVTIDACGVESSPEIPAILRRNQNPKNFPEQLLAYFPMHHPVSIEPSITTKSSNNASAFGSPKPLHHSNF